MRPCVGLTAGAGDLFAGNPNRRVERRSVRLSDCNHMTKYLTTNSVAEELGVTQRRVVQYIAAGQLRATRRGRDWFIRPADIEAVRVRTPGRPKKPDRMPAC